MRVDVRRAPARVHRRREATICDGARDAWMLERGRGAAFDVKTYSNRRSSRLRNGIANAVDGAHCAVEYVERDARRRPYVNAFAEARDVARDDASERSSTPCAKTQRLRATARRDAGRSGKNAAASRGRERFRACSKSPRAMWGHAARSAGSAICAALRADFEACRFRAADGAKAPSAADFERALRLYAGSRFSTRGP